MRTLSWADFDRALDSAVARLASCSLSGVYGVPRGGLVLAVCLSHRLGIPLLEQPQAGCLVVDDIYETGRTVAAYRERSDLTTLVWISKVPPLSSRSGPDARCMNGISTTAPWPSCGTAEA